MKKIIVILIFTSAIVSGCFHPRTKREVPEVPQAATPPGEEIPTVGKTPPSPLPDENDYLDEALKELDEIE